MGRIVNASVIISFFIIGLTPLFASLPVANNDSAGTKRKTSVTIVPIVDYTPETKVAAGLGGLYYFRRRDEDMSKRPSSISGGFNYTLRHQYGAELYPEMYFNHHKIRFFGKVQLFKYPDWFWGVGEHDVNSKRELYSSQGANALMTCLFKTRWGINIGPRYEFRYDVITNKVPDGLFSAPNIIGGNGGTVSGLGIVVTKDTRNNIFSSSQGVYLEISSMDYFSQIGSNFRFNLMTIDYRRYYKVTRKTVFAAQFYTSLMNGDPPFYSLSQFGGQNLMRGYYYGKYIDKNMTAIQAEYRFPLFWRFGMVAFAGTGNIGSGASEIFQASEIKYAFGTGLRFALKPDEKLNVRFDIATGRDGVQYYLFFAEAF